MVALGKIYQEDCLSTFTKIDDKALDLIVTDPPYALGSDVVIRSDGKPDYSKAVDFMLKWKQPDGKFWEKWFQEAFRTLKYGGRVVMFGMDRQLMLNKYYACAAGFQEQQSIYWYYILSFPKATDLGKMIDNNAKATSKVVGVVKRMGNQNPEFNGKAAGRSENSLKAEYAQTEPATELAKKYEGYKYSVSPLKQTTETIMVFQKPYKTGSCLHDTLAFEKGDKECCCGALNIEGSRVPASESYVINTWDDGAKTFGGGAGHQYTGREMTGRYPAQTFCDKGTAEALDKQSGVKKGDGHMSYKSAKGGGIYEYGLKDMADKGAYKDVGGCSKILHKCLYDEGDFDLYFYCTKAGRKERDSGLDVKENVHPTVKPVSLMRHIMKLFKTPNVQVLFDPFVGSGSTLIAAKEAGFEYLGAEINVEYCQIAERRIHGKKVQEEEVGGQGDLFGEQLACDDVQA